METFNTEYLFENCYLNDLNPLKAGRVICSAPPLPGDPRIHDYTTLYYMLRGEGVLRKDDSSHTVRPGQCFLVPPGELNTIRAEQNGPWEYVWISFNGRLQSNFASLFNTVSVSDAPEALFRELIQTFEISQNIEKLAYFLAGQLYRLYFDLSTERVSYSHFVRKAKNYIDTMYMQDISVQSISDMLNMDRHYLSRVFKKQIGQTMQAYLLKVRLSKAALLIKEDHTVSQAAQMVGYSDISNFSRKFKEVYGVPPKDYGKQKPVQPMSQYSLQVPNTRGENWSPKQWGR